MSDIKSQILYLEQTLEELKAAQRKNYNANLITQGTFLSMLL